MDERIGRGCLRALKLVEGLSAAAHATALSNPRRSA
jgi:hypothetical protein